MILGAIEGGGTKFVCACLNDDLEIVNKISFPTRTPQETMNDVFNFFDQYNIDAFGIGSFGPIDMNIDSKTYGYITSTPKKGWQNFNFLGKIKERYNVPVAWNTDVSVSCLGEYIKGAGKGKKEVLYLTIGTGIGGGVVYNGQILNNWNSPEMGHIYVKRHKEDIYEGICPYHKDCLEGLASGPSIEKRYNIKGQYLDSNHKIWNIIAFYIGQALWNYTLTLVPNVIILGGGVAKQKLLLDKIKTEFKKLANSYVNYPNLDEYIVLAKLNDDQALIGCGQLAKNLLNKN